MAGNGVAPFMTQPSRHNGLALIALFKLFKGIVLLLIGVGLLGLVDPEIATFLAPVLDVFHLHGHARLLHSLLVKVTALSSHTLGLMAYTSLLYAAILLVEGFGLWREAAWAGYMTVVSTSVFLPGEFYEVMQQVSVMHAMVFLINVAIVGYLVRRLGAQTFR